VQPLQNILTYIENIMSFDFHYERQEVIVLEREDFGHIMRNATKARFPIFSQTSVTSITLKFT
jgi:hypothetical protein